MNETKVLDELKMWSDVNAEEFTAVNLSALARGCDMRRVDAVEAVQNLLLAGDLEQVRVVAPGSHTNVFRLIETSF
ncbi:MULTISPECIES: hypothetical protein [Micrococcales]|uniref:hypothetical protein n=1 Tax=Micrococcales TaxID=85006 RepID=UPI0018DF0BC6|nr:hypothetical protein [Brevibacterium yomogidense]